LPKRLTYEFVKEQFEKRNYTLLETKYINAHAKMQYMCNKHGEQTATYNNFSKGKGCPKCGDEITASKLRHPFEFVKSVFESHGYQLLETKFIDGKTPMRFICPIHGEQTIRFDNLQYGYRCNRCGIDSASEKMKFSHEFIKSEFEKYGYKLLSTEYINSKLSLNILCSKHGEITTSYSSLMANGGHACLKCAGEKRSGENNIRWQGGITPLSLYLRNHLDDWKHQQFERVSYICEITGKQGVLNVHHMYSFKNILEITMKQLQLPIHLDIGNYTSDELRLITSTLLDNNEKLSQPIVMLEAIHKEFHSFCGGNNADTSFEQLEEFKALLQISKAS
jgi:predicted RNA-binding Zn-ribbon protein involved in translation (DUF1610 family)